jgi:uncharacterized membrane protein
MPRPQSQGNSHNEHRAHSSRLSQRWPVVAAIVCVVLAALTLVGCSSSGAPQQVQAAPVATPRAVAAVAQPTVAKTSPALGSQFTLLAARDGVVSVPAAGLSAGKARFYSIRNGDQWIPFFVVQGADGVVRAALDACDICFESRQGFRQEGDVMVCNACGSRFPITQINVELGGCNPVGLKAVVQGDQVTIRLTDLEAGARYF